MSRFARLRHHPRFSDYFDAVHPLFWLVLVWNLRRMIDQIDARGGGDALISISWWGGVSIDYLSDPAPSGHRSIAPSRKPWSDVSWASSIPSELLSELRALVCPRLNGESGGALSTLTMGACARSAHADTS